MILKKCFLTRNDCYQKGQKIDNGKPTGIVVHSTGANNPYIKRYVQPLKTDADYAEIVADIGINKYNNSWNVSYKAGETTRQVCVHAFIGKNAAGVIETYQTLPFDICCWGCANGKNGSYNRNPNARVQFEICEDGLTDRSYFDAVFKEAAEFCAYLCSIYGFGVDKICSHHEAYSAGYGSNHEDTDHWMKKFGLNMDWFRCEVQKLIDAWNITELEDATENTGTQQENTPELGDLAAGDLVKIASGATYYSGKEVPAWVVGQNWYIKSVRGDRAVIDKSESGKNSINSPINVKYLTIVADESDDNTTTQHETKKTNAEIIWDFLLDEIGNEFGVAGLMGNLRAESALHPNNLQDTYEKKLGFTDESYTDAVDNGTYGNFVHDSAGYGLAQWTHYSRKQKLLDYAKESAKSIGDLDMQLTFLAKELEGYGTVYSVLKNANSVKVASDIVMAKYESPADQSDEKKEKRAEFGQAYYDQFAKAKPSLTVGDITADMKRQMVIDEYTTILGRNIYSQSKRDYCFKTYSDGKYYSDCSSSVSYCYKEAGFGFGILNTVGMYQSDKLKEVPVQIKNGQIQNPEILRKGDMLLFAGTDTGRAYAGYVGHVEMIYDIDGETITLCGHGSGNPSTKNMVTYCKSRYSAKASTPVGNKGLIKVVRYIQDDGTD